MNENKFDIKLTDNAPDTLTFTVPLGFNKIILNLPDKTKGFNISMRDNSIFLEKIGI